MKAYKISFTIDEVVNVPDDKTEDDAIAFVQELLEDGALKIIGDSNHRTFEVDYDEVIGWDYSPPRDRLES